MRHYPTATTKLLTLILSEGPPILKKILSSEKTLFLGLVAFRATNALIIQTSFVPDEYWQTLEVAHHMAFGYGHLTWEWKQGLRSYVYPAVFAVMYKFLALVHLDSRILLIKLPRLLQGVMAAVGDLYLYKLSHKLSGSRRVAQWSLLCQLTSWFMFYCCTRTLGNSVETVLTTVAFYHFPWPRRHRKAQWKYITLVALAIVVRPTAAIVWLPLVMWHMWMYRSSFWKLTKMFAERGFVVLFLSSLIDRFFYGQWMNVHYNFLQFNILHDMAGFYGTHPWHWYLSQGFAVIMGTHLFPFLLAVKHAMEPVLLAVIAWTTFVYSLLGHKEFRFLLPVLPLTMHLCGTYLHYITDTCHDDGDGDGDGLSRRPEAPQRRRHYSSGVCSWKVFLVISLVLTNLPIAMYTSLLHQRGTVDVTRFLHDQGGLETKDRRMSVFFLMPCHSTPYYSYIHRNISMRFLTCEPNLSRRANYSDEAEVFFWRPDAWLKVKDNFDDVHPPSHLVMFSVLHTRISTFLDRHNYTDCAKVFHTHVPEGRVSSHVIVSCHETWNRRKTPRRATFGSSFDRGRH
ncbi:hypothetical protein NP493_49g03045 [Ridgeia piscesae]|uniref:Mannosyltransferase n=1 Tax=Ridgeia piscesae TaxID=27915 RepID=A0AAD9UJ71_RIDPI|nr:hypothetical protein NP493_49g03045 [Ridgeia piscesae]